MLKESAGDKYFMHESYDIDDINKYTREWFAWANSFFGVFKTCLGLFFGITHELFLFKILNFL